MDGNDLDRSDLLQAFDTAASKDSRGNGKSLTAAEEAEFMAFLDDPSLSEDQKRQIVQALWPIILTFVEIGFGTHPVQLACGKPTKDLESNAQTDSHGGEARIADQTKKTTDEQDQI